jgi:hypothetical protein
MVVTVFLVVVLVIANYVWLFTFTPLNQIGQQVKLGNIISEAVILFSGVTLTIVLLVGRENAVILSILGIIVGFHLATLIWSIQLFKEQLR